MGIFVPMDNYMVILAEVGRWKVIGMRSLYNNLNLSSSYSLFCRQVRKLEFEGLIRSIIGMGKRKYLTLTSSGSEMSPETLASLEFFRNQLSLTTSLKKS